MARIITFRSKAGVWQNEIETEPLEANLFLEFGRRVGEDYRYIALMQGDANYTRAKDVQQLYFTHRIGDRWVVLDDTCVKLVEEYDTEAQAVARLRSLAKKIARRSHSCKKG